MNTSLAIGHDAEVFVTQGGVISSVIGHLGGTKKEPLPVNLGAVQEDNVLAELNIHPAYNREAFIGNTTEVMRELKRLLPEEFDILVASSHSFTKRELYGFGDKAFEFGCEPDFNAWTLEKNPRPNDESVMRTAGGHIHFGFGTEPVTMANQVDTIKMADYLMGVPSVIYDRDTKRRSLYGNAGAFRPKPYGVEYRTMSNFWLGSDELMGWAYDTAVQCFEHRGDLELLMNVVDPVEVVQAINTGNAKLAEKLMKQMGSAVTWL